MAWVRLLPFPFLYPNVPAHFQKLVLFYMTWIENDKLGATKLQISRRLFRRLIIPLNGF
jgi:hypothetical protein